MLIACLANKEMTEIYCMHWFICSFLWNDFESNLSWCARIANVHSLKQCESHAFSKEHRTSAAVNSLAFHLTFYKSDKSPVSIFSFDAKKSANRVAVASNSFKRLRTLRHPNILTFSDGLDIEGPNIAYIVTEEVTPLEDALVELKTFPGWIPFQHSFARLILGCLGAISWGLFQIAVSGHDFGLRSSTYFRLQFLS